jgi:hypothetical protein
VSVEKKSLDSGEFAFLLRRGILLDLIPNDGRFAGSSLKSKQQRHEEAEKLLAAGWTPGSAPFYWRPP